jgi:acyl-CoA synthetase (NDP forming)
VLATQPVLAGPNVVVLANARSPEILARAAVDNAGLVAVDGPVSLDWRSTPTDYGVAVRAALAAADVDGVLVLHAPPLAEAVAAPVDEIETAATGAAKPVVAVMLGGGDGPLQPGSRVPSFSFPEPAAAVLGRSYAYAHWLRTEGASEPADVTAIDRAGAAQVIAAALDNGAASLDVDAAIQVLASYGIPVPATATTTADQAAASAGTIGYPVAIKAEHRRPGRSARAGVALDLADAGDVAAALEVMRGSLGSDADRVVVQAMVAPGIDLRIRCTSEERLGASVSVGLGGQQADVIAEEESRLAPLSSASAEALVAESRAGPALERAGFDPAPVIDVLVRVAQLGADHPELTLIELNPVIASAGHAWATDAILNVSPAGHVETPIRRLA